MSLLKQVLIGAALLVAATQPRSAGATPLNLTLDQFPDILSQFVDVTYDTASQLLQAQGIALQINAAPGTTLNILNGAFAIGILTDGTSVGGVAANNLVIGGDVDVDGDSVIDATGLLLSGEIAQFGASTAGPGLFEFVFNITGGAFAGTLFTQPQVGVILGLDGSSTYTGSFAVNFSNLIGGLAGSGAGSADTAPVVPEPATLLLFGAGVAGLAGFGRRRFRKATVVAGMLLGLAAAGPASATLLGNPVQFPLLSFDNGGVMSYDATTDSLRVDAFPIALRLAPGAQPRFITPNLPVAGEFFTIALSVDSAGNFAGGSGGDDLSIFGFIDLDGDSVIDVGGLLLTGEATAFGFQDNGGPTDFFDFTFTVTGGGLAGLFTSTVSVMLQSENSSFTGSFDESFAGAPAKGTLSSTPEPAGILLLGAGLSGLAFLGRRRAA
jgi:phage baseplate assembly protein gpV